MNITDGVRLRTSDVVTGRGDKQVFPLPDLNLHGGESVAIVGPSGCGKTTTLLALAGIRAPKAGTIVLDGTDLWAAGPRERDRLRGRRIGLVFQSFHLVDSLSVGNNIRLAAVCAGTDAKSGPASREDALMARLDLTGIKSHRADHISHGQAQRVAIARALMNRPAVILADEPTSALDDGNTKALMKLLIENCAADRAALVVTTHDKRVLDYIDTIITLEATS